MYELNLNKKELPILTPDLLSDNPATSPKKFDSRLDTQPKVKSVVLAQGIQANSPPTNLRCAGSLKSDTMFGWKPQPTQSDITPIPLCFGLVEYNQDDLIKADKIIYLGPRYRTSFKLHEAFANKVTRVSKMVYEESHPFTLKEENASLQSYTFKQTKGMSGLTGFDSAFDGFAAQMAQDDKKYNYYRNQLQINQITSEAEMIQGTLPLKFNSDFESGNLDFVARTFIDRNDEYDLLMRLDSNSRNHQQWYYFSASTFARGSYAGVKVKFNLLNFTKPNNLYQQGLQPIVWSEKLYASKGIGWHRAGTEITYSRSRLTRIGYRQPCSCLSFSYTYKYDDDKVFFAYSIPYTFSMLTSFLATIQKEHQNQDKCQIFQLENIGQSLSGVAIPLVTITDFRATGPKKTVLINGRVHPGETQASWILHFFMRFLLSKTAQAQFLRQRTVFKIIPILNVDGVISGNYRTSFAGFDINRMFGESANKRLNPEATLVKQLAKEKKLAFFFDVHGHSRKKSVFMYGPYYPLHSEHYLKIRLLPKLLAQRTQIFRFYSCRYANERSKQNCSRLALNRELQLPESYTIECSMWGYLCKETRKTIDLTLTNIMKFSQAFAMSLYDWFYLIDKQREDRIKRAVHLQNIKSKNKHNADGPSQAKIQELLGSEEFEECKEMIDEEQRKYVSTGQVKRSKVSQQKEKKRKKQSSDLKQQSQLSTYQEASKGEHSQELKVSDSTSQLPSLKETTFEATLQEQQGPSGLTGLDLHPMCGFEWLYPQKPANLLIEEQKKVYSQKTRRDAQRKGGQDVESGGKVGINQGAVIPQAQAYQDKDQVSDGTIYAENLDLDFANELEEQPPGLDEIYQEIRTDITKAQSMMAKASSGAAGKKNGKVKHEAVQQDLEAELDSLKDANSSQEDSDEGPLGGQLNAEENRVQDCLMAYFTHIEEGIPYEDQSILLKSKQKPVPKQRLTSTRPQTAAVATSCGTIKIVPKTSSNRQRHVLNPAPPKRSSKDLRLADTSKDDSQQTKLLTRDVQISPQQPSYQHPAAIPTQSAYMHKQLSSRNHHHSSSHHDPASQTKIPTLQPADKATKQKRQLQPFVHKIAVRRVEKTLAQGPRKQMDPQYKLVPPIELQQQVLQQHLLECDNKNRITHQPSLQTAQTVQADVAKACDDYTAHIRNEHQKGNLSDKQFVSMVRDHEKATQRLQSVQNQQWKHETIAPKHHLQERSEQVEQSEASRQQDETKLQEFGCPSGGLPERRPNLTPHHPRDDSNFRVLCVDGTSSRSGNTSQSSLRIKGPRKPTPPVQLLPSTKEPVPSNSTFRSCLQRATIDIQRPQANEAASKPQPTLVTPRCDGRAVVFPHSWAPKSTQSKALPDCTNPSAPLRSLQPATLLTSTVCPTSPATAQTLPRALALTRRDASLTSSPCTERARGDDLPRAPSHAPPTTMCSGQALPPGQSIYSSLTQPRAARLIENMLLSSSKPPAAATCRQSRAAHPLAPAIQSSTSRQEPLPTTAKSYSATSDLSAHRQISSRASQMQTERRLTSRHHHEAPLQQQASGTPGEKGSPWATSRERCPEAAPSKVCTSPFRPSRTPQ